LADVAKQISDQSNKVTARVANEGGDVQLEIFSNDDATELTASVPTKPVGSNPTFPKDVRVDGAIAELADTRAAIGTTRDLVETTQTRLEDDQTRLNNDISDVEDIELQRTLTLLAENQQSLQASFATTSRLQQTSILNFLR
jgi:flagellin-like hook-associated protein FlgL